MQTIDLERFEVEFQKLCANFDKPATKQRKDAYWQGLRKMSILQFERSVDIAIGEDGPETFPNPKALWKLYRQSQGGGSAQRAASPAKPDCLEAFANRLLFLHMTHRGGLASTGTFIPGERHISGMNNCKPSTDLQACLAFKRELVEEFRGYVQAGDDDATPAAFYQYWLSGLRRISKVEQRTIDALNAAMEHPDALKPFERAMAQSMILDGEPA